MASIIIVFQFTDHSVPLVAIVLAIRTFSHKRTNVILPHWHASVTPFTTRCQLWTNTCTMEVQATIQMPTLKWYASHVSILVTLLSWHCSLKCCLCFFVKSICTSYSFNVSHFSSSDNKPPCPSFTEKIDRFGTSQLLVFPLWWMGRVHAMFFEMFWHLHFWTAFRLLSFVFSYLSWISLTFLSDGKSNTWGSLKLGRRPGSGRALSLAYF